MNDISQMIKTAEKLEQQGKFAEADQLMQKVSISLAEIATKYGPQALEMAKRYGPQALAAYNEYKQSKQPQIPAPSNEVPGEFAQQPPVVKSPLNPQPAQVEQKSARAIVEEFKSELGKVVSQLQANLQTESQKAGGPREKQRIQDRTKVFQKLINNILFNQKKAIDLAKKFLTYQFQKSAETDSKKTIFAYNTQELANLGIDRKEVSMKGLASENYQSSLEKWQQTFLKPIFDKFFQQINKFAKTHGADPSKQITIKSPNIDPTGQIRLPGMEGF